METYKIVRMNFEGKPKIIKRRLSLEEARRHCKRKDTHKKDSKGKIIWFDGYEKE